MGNRRRWAMATLPLKISESTDRPYSRCVAHIDLTRDECAGLFPSGRMRSPPFRLAGRGFVFSASCSVDQRSGLRCLGLFLEMVQQEEGGSASAASGGGGRAVTVGYEFAARTTAAPAGEFVGVYNGQYAFKEGKAVGYRDLLSAPWPTFVAEDSVFFVDGVLHLRAELAAKQPMEESGNEQ